MQSIFFYIESLVEVETFDKDSADFARQILDLYTDVVVCGTAGANNGTGVGGAPSSPTTSSLEEFRKAVRQSSLHEVLAQKLGSYVPQIREQEGGRDSVDRFTAAVNSAIAE